MSRQLPSWPADLPDPEEREDGVLLRPSLALALSNRLLSLEKDPSLEEQIALCEAHSAAVWDVALQNEAAAVAQARADMQGLGFWGTFGLVLGAGVGGLALGLLAGILVAQ